MTWDYGANYICGVEHVTAAVSRNEVPKLQTKSMLDALSEQPELSRFSRLVLTMLYVRLCPEVTQEQQ